MPVATTDAFRRILVQPDDITIVAEQVGDTLTLVAGSGISLVANATSDQITIVSAGVPGIQGEPGPAGPAYSWSIAADDSTQRNILSGETVKFIGAGAITTSSDAEGNITITGTAGPAYSWSIAADDSTQRNILSGETVKFIGAGAITTSSDAEGNITITGTAASTGNVTFTGSTINTSDSSDIGISKSIIPTTDNVYDLGSSTLRFRHLYVGPGTIYIGDQTRAITATANSIDLPSGTTIGGEEPLKTTIQNIFNEIINNYLVYNDIIGAPTDISDFNDTSNSLVSKIVKITGITYPVGQSHVLITGGETVTLTGVGFKTLCNVYLNGAPVASTSFVSETSVTFVTPVVSTVGTYQLTLINQDGTSADWAGGIIFVTLASPKFTDPAGLLETFSRNSSRTTTLDVVGGTSPYTFAITAGALPSGLTLNTSTGVISGTTPDVSADTVYNFIARVTDSAAATSSSAFQIAVVIPVPWEIGLSTFNIISNYAFMTELEEDLVNEPSITLGSFNIRSNLDFFIELEEDFTNSPEITLGSFSITSFTP